MKKVYSALAYILIALVVVFIYFGMRKPIKVALLSDFEAERSNFNTNSLIGGKIAEEIINSSQGILGRRTQLITKNTDLDNPEEVINFLKKEKIEVMLTAANSHQLLKLAPLLKKNNITCISVGATSCALSEQDDNIYRVYPDDRMEVDALMHHFQEYGISKKFSIIYDKKNVEFKDSVANEITTLGGEVISQDSWNENPLQYKLNNLQIAGSSILILASPIDTAGIVQALKNQNIKQELYGMSWSGDYNLIYYGGRAVEGFTFISPLDYGENQNKYEALKGFNEKLKNNYKKKIGFVSAGVYDAFITVRDTYVDKYKKHISFLDALNGRKEFTSLSVSIPFDQYGDSEGKEYFYTVKDGEFSKILHGGEPYERK